MWTFEQNPNGKIAVFHGPKPHESEEKWVIQIIGDNMRSGILKLLKEIDRKIDEKNEKIDKLTFEVECMTLAFIEHYNLNKMMVHYKRGQN